jgi:hypothetical protein
MTTATRTPARYSLARALAVAYPMNKAYDQGLDPRLIARLASTPRELAAMDTLVRVERDLGLTPAAQLALDTDTWIDPATDLTPTGTWDDALTEHTATPVPMSPALAPAPVVASDTHTPTVGIMAALDMALSTIRTHNPNVPTALAVVISTGRGKVHGSFQAGSWSDTAGTHEGSARHELLIASESLGLGAEQVLTTLIHEAGHALAHATGVKDTSRQGRFHNGEFRTIAERMGLVCTGDAAIGTRTPGLTESAKVLYAPTLELLASALTSHRKPVAKKETPKTTIRVACDCLTDSGTPLAVTVPIKWFDAQALVCSDCIQPLAPVKKHPPLLTLTGQKTMDFTEPHNTIFVCADCALWDQNREHMAGHPDMEPWCELPWADVTAIDIGDGEILDDCRCPACGTTAMGPRYPYAVWMWDARAQEDIDAELLDTPWTSPIRVVIEGAI